MRLPCIARASGVRLIVFPDPESGIFTA